MNIEDTKKAIKVMQAYVDGNEIEFDGELIEDPIWSWGSRNGTYKTKPRPLEIWVMVNSKGDCLSNQATEEGCIEIIQDLNDFDNDFTDYKAVLFRQVLDESV